MINKFCLITIVLFSLIGCEDDPVMSKECGMGILGEWDVKEHYIVFENDTLHTEYEQAFTIDFKSNMTGTSFRLDPEAFTWSCDSSSITFIKEVSYFLDFGKYVILNRSDSLITLQRHQLTDGISVVTGDSSKIEDWRTWVLTK